MIAELIQLPNDRSHSLTMLALDLARPTAVRKHADSAATIGHEGRSPPYPAIQVPLTSAGQKNGEYIFE